MMTSQSSRLRPQTLKMGNHEMDLHVSKAVPQTFDLHIAAQPYTYRIDQWCALNEPNWKRYNEMTGMVERVTFLERILTGNILSFAKGVGWHIEEEIKCKILAIDHAHPRRVKGVNMSCMRLAFQSNAALPDLIGLGKHVSINYGTITRNNQ